MSEENKQINTGGPAFPLNWEKQGEFWAFGITARDYFAAKAMQGLCAGFASPEGAWPDSGFEEHYEVVANHAYLFADAMLKARDPK